MGISFGGIVSGLDTQTLIDQLMQLERRPIQLLEQKQARIQTESDLYSTLASRLSSLQNAADDLLELDGFEGKSTTSTDEGVATASASAAATATSYDLVVTTLARAHRVASNQQADSASALGLAGTFAVNGTNVTVSAGMSLADIRNEINSADAGVEATIVDDRLVLESSETGTANVMSLADVGGDTVLDSLGVLAGGAINLELQAAQDANFSVDGLNVTRPTNSVTDVVQGVTFDLIGTGSTTITVSRDVDSAVEKVNAFVDAYNRVQSFLSDQTSYKEGQSVGTVTLQGDFLAVNLKNTLRQRMTDTVSTTGNMDQLALVGITTDTDGALTVNDSTLRNALASDPEQVRLLFSGDASEDGFDGVARRVESYLDAYTKNSGIIDDRKVRFTQMIGDITDSITRYEDRLVQREEALVRQFAAMEQAMLAMQSQSTALNGMASQLSGF